MNFIYSLRTVLMGALLTLMTQPVMAQQKIVPPEAVGEVVKNVEDMATQHIDTAKNLINIIIEFTVKYSFQVLGGFIVLFLGWMLARFVCNFVLKLLKKNKVDVTVSKFLTGTVRLSIMAFAVIVALGKFGIEIAPLIAGISVIGFATSFALQGPLSNYASGASLVFTKPFKVGDIIEVAGVVGEVVDLKLPRTELKTVDGELINVPNKHIVGEIIHNFSVSKRVDVKVGVSYAADVDKAIELMREVILGEESVIKSKEPKIGITEFGDSSINIYARSWCKQDHYWETLFSLNRKIFAAFNKNGIVIPFPQRDVHLIKNAE